MCLVRTRPAPRAARSYRPQFKCSNSRRKATGRGSRATRTISIGARNPSTIHRFGIPSRMCTIATRLSGREPSIRIDTSRSQPPRASPATTSISRSKSISGRGASPTRRHRESHANSVRTTVVVSVCCFVLSSAVLVLRPPGSDLVLTGDFTVNRSFAEDSAVSGSEQAVIAPQQKSSCQVRRVDTHLVIVSPSEKTRLTASTRNMTIRGNGPSPFFRAPARSALTRVDDQRPRRR